MQALIDDVKAQRWRRPLILAAAATVTFLMIVTLARMATAPALELLYARLDPAVASRILTELEGRGVVSELRGDSIYVDAAARDRLRLDLAAEGLPGSEGAGYELLDTLSGFGTTSQMFDATLTRAREGELSRTLLAGSGVAAARVHIADASRSPFSRDTGATASVTLMMKTGDVPPELAKAAQSLVSGAVFGLAASDVTVVDARTGRLVSDAGDTRGTQERLDRLAEMRASVDRLLSARVGPGRFVAEVSLETTNSEELTRQRLLDPESRIVISTDTQESAASGSEPASQGVTVASNLPDGDAGQGAGTAESQSSETRELVNYEVSETERQITRGAGAVERISVAVMVDGVFETGADGQAVWAPRPDAELTVIQELVQSAVGYREDRGDVVTVRTLRFEAPVPESVEAVDLPYLSGAQLTKMMTVGALALVALAVMAFIIKPLLAAAAEDPESSDAALQLEGPGNAQEALPSIAGTGGETGDLPELEAAEGVGDLPSLTDLPGLDSMDFSPGGDVIAEDPVEKLRQLISDRQSETMDVLKGWIEEDVQQEEAT